MAYIALLRGINVSGKNKLPMADLRQLSEGIGWKNVQSYIQSGNLLFEADTLPQAEDLSVAIKREYAYEVPVLLRTQEYFRQALTNPFLEATPDLDTKTLHVTFLVVAPAPSAIAALEEVDPKADRWQVIDDRVYLHCPNGYGRTKLTNNYLEKKLGQIATTRNWRTLHKLATWE